jgi:hypothetical protein
MDGLDRIGSTLGDFLYAVLHPSVANLPAGFLVLVFAVLMIAALPEGAREKMRLAVWQSFPTQRILGLARISLLCGPACGPGGASWRSAASSAELPGAMSSVSGSTIRGALRLEARIASIKKLGKSQPEVRATPITGMLYPPTGAHF